MAKRYDQEIITRLLEQRRSRGLTYRQISEESGVPIPTIASWVRRERREAAPVDTLHASGRLVPVSLQPEPGERTLRIELGAGLSLAVDRRADPEILAGVLAQLLAAC